VVILTGGGQALAFPPSSLLSSISVACPIPPPAPWEEHISLSNPEVCAWAGLALTD
jgi:hypothetical protein